MDSIEINKTISVLKALLNGHNIKTTNGHEFCLSEKYEILGLMYEDGDELKPTWVNTFDNIQPLMNLVKNADETWLLGIQMNEVISESNRIDRSKKWVDLG